MLRHSLATLEGEYEFIDVFVESKDFSVSKNKLLYKLVNGSMSAQKDNAGRLAKGVHKYLFLRGPTANPLSKPRSEK